MIYLYLTSQLDLRCDQAAIVRQLKHGFESADLGDTSSIYCYEQYILIENMASNPQKESGSALCSQNG